MEIQSAPPYNQPVASGLLNTSFAATPEFNYKFTNQGIY